jgi:16S rRNA (cytidine1402-2'-O)-methyltransferase
MPTTADGSDAPGASKPAPGLYLVATPIGNARDITLHALDVLRLADVIACEDTRVTRTLLTLYGISATVMACHDHNEATAAARIVAGIAAGQVIAMVSDAGMPAISDPGRRVVRAVVDAGLFVTAIPGPSAVLTALILSGLPAEPFLFGGFLPGRTAERRQRIAGFASVPATLVFFEAPHRLTESLADLADLLGPRPAAVARELTKRFEEVRRAPLDELARHYAGTGAPRGEIVLVIAPPGPKPAASAADIDEALRTALAGTGVREAAAEVAARFGRPRREVYARALALKRMLD